MVVLPDGSVSNAIHDGTYCGGCDVSPITGVCHRFKYAEGNNICGKCFAGMTLRPIQAGMYEELLSPKLLTGKCTQNFIKISNAELKHTHVEN